jgi:hypothetical protein
MLDSILINLDSRLIITLKIEILRQKNENSFASIFLTLKSQSIKRKYHKFAMTFIFLKINKI